VKCPAINVFINVFIIAASDRWNPADGVKISIRQCEKIFVESINGSPHDFDLFAISAIKELKIPHSIITQKDIYRRRLNISKRTPVFGCVKTVISAIKQAKGDYSFNTYPQVADQFLNRVVRKTSLSKSILMVESGMQVFCKPFDKTKAFTGRVMRCDDDLYEVKHLSKNTPVWVAPPVHIASEWRLFLLDGTILGLRHYDGITNKPDKEFVDQIVESFAGSNLKTCAVDIGIIEGGWFVIEVNPPYSVDPYGLDPKKYVELLCCGWASLFLPPGHAH